MSLSDRAAEATSVLATVARMGRGIYTKPAAAKPAALLELYEYEGCPFCRLVREALTELDLDALVRPSPRGGTRFRPQAIELGGKAQFPFLVDPNTGRQLYESADIIAYLFETYGQRPVPVAWQLPSLQAMSSGMASAWRAGRGSRAKPSKAPAQPLELWSIESSPYARLVRERLTELELPYRLRSAGRTQLRESVPPFVREPMGLKVEPTTENRRLLMERTGRLMVPFLVDPNTGDELFESGEILRYLNATYGA